MIPNNTNFYRDLPVTTSFAEATESRQHAYVPRDWYCDCGFGRIDVGDYKKLNTVGVPCIATVVNMGSTIDLPFIFGGDGATFALPDVLRVTEEEGQQKAVLTALNAAGKMYQVLKITSCLCWLRPIFQSQMTTYQRVLEKIQSIYGDVEQYHPVRADRMQLTFNPKLLSQESRVRSSHLNALQCIQYFAKMLLMNAAVRILIAKNIDTEAVKWTNYRNDLVENSDFRKFEGMLRMVMDGKNTQVVALEKYLESEYQSGNLVYGSHQSPQAPMTLIVQFYHGNHLHFVDGSNGGYTVASKQLKRRLFGVDNLYANR